MTLGAHKVWGNYLMNGLVACALCASVPIGVMAQSDKPSRLPLGGGISLVEIDESNAEHTLYSKSDIYNIDVNSSLLIQLDPQSITSSLIGTEPRNESAVIPAAVIEQRSKLLEAMDALNACLNVAGRIASQIQTFTTTAEIPGFSELVRQHGQSYIDLKARIKEYLTRRAASAGSANDPEDELDELYEGTPKAQTEKIRGFLQGEIARLDAESAKRAATIKSSGVPYSLQLSASLTRAGKRIERVHVPGYDTLQEGEYKPIEKISFAMPEEDRKKLQTEMAFNRDLATRLNETKNLREGLSVTFTKLFEEQADRVRKFLADANLTAASISRIVVEATDTDATQSLETPVGDVKTHIEMDSRNLAVLVRESSVAIGKFQRDIAGILPNESRLAAIAESGDPVDALEQLLKQTAGVPVQAEAAYKDLDAKLSVISSSMTMVSNSLKETISGFPAKERDAVLNMAQQRVSAVTQIRGVLDNFREVSYAPLIASLNSFQNRSGDLKLTEKSLAITSGFDPRMLDKTTTLRTMDNIVDTRISIPRTSRRDGDQVEVIVMARDTMASPEQKTPAVLAERSLLFSVRKFGAYSDFSTGAAAFFGTSNTSDETAEFGAVASYVVHKRARDSKAWNFINPGIGIHTAGISTGLGAGISLHLFPDNFVQVGIGRTFRSNVKNEWYTFVGIRLFNLKLPSANMN